MDNALSTLCSRCSQVFHKDYQVGCGDRVYNIGKGSIRHREPKETVRELHYPSYRAFEKVAASGKCHLCLLFWAQIPENDRIELRQVGAEGVISLRQSFNMLYDEHLFDIQWCYAILDEGGEELKGTKTLDLQMNAVEDAVLSGSRIQIISLH